MPERHRFGNVFDQYLKYEDIERLASEANVSHDDVRTMMLGNPTARNKAECILNAFDRIVRKRHTLSQFDLMLLDDDEER